MASVGVSGELSRSDVSGAGFTSGVDELTIGAPVGESSDGGCTAGNGTVDVTWSEGTQHCAVSTDARPSEGPELVTAAATTGSDTGVGALASCDHVTPAAEVSRSFRPSGTQLHLEHFSTPGGRFVTVFVCGGPGPKDGSGGTFLTLSVVDFRERDFSEARSLLFAVECLPASPWLEDVMGNTVVRRVSV